MIKKHTIPTILGLFILIIGLIVGVVLVQREVIFKSQASPGQTPREIRITNISDTSFTVSWTTTEQVAGFVTHGTTTSLGLTTESTQAAQTHHVNITNLNPSTIYYFEIGSGQSVFDNNGQPYQVTTAGASVAIPQANIASGRVVNQAGIPQPNTIVYIEASGTSPLSTTTGTDGRWSKNLAQARTVNLASFTQVNSETTLNIFVQAGGGNIASTRIRAGAAKTTPDIKLGEHKDITQIQTTEEGEEIPSSTLQLPETQEQSRFNLEEEPPTQGEPTVTITAPTHGQQLTTKRPTFTGTGTPGTRLTITVESSHVINTTTTVATDGTWSWTPTQDVQPGNHTITVSWTEDGEEKTAIRPFTITAAAAGTITPTPTQAPAFLPSEDSEIPVAGNLTLTITTIIMGLLLILMGFFIPKFLKP